jgi:hypothetical protein
MFEKWVASLPVALRWEDQSEELREAWCSLGEEFNTLDALPNWYKEAHGA